MRQPSELCFNLSDECPEHRFLPFFDVHLESEVQRLHHGSVHHPHEVAEGLSGVHHEREYIVTSRHRTEDERLAIVFVERLHLYLVLLCCLEVHLFCSFGHQFAVVRNHLPSPAAEQLHDFFDVVVVFFLRNPSTAAPPALSYVEIEAGACLSTEN